MSSGEKRRSLRSQRKPRVVVELPPHPDLRDELYRQADRFGWQIYDLSINLFTLPVNPPPDGAIISSPAGSYRDKHQSRTFTCPTVRLGHVGMVMSKFYPRVLQDRHAAGTLAVDYFHEHGFNDILIVLRLPWDDADASYYGVRDRAKELGINLHVLTLNDVKDYDRDEQNLSWNNEIGEHLEALPRPLAFLGSNDEWAARFCFTCESRGLSVPEDVSVLGINNISHLCQSAPVPLSSMDLNRPLQIQRAMELLKGMMDGEAPPKQPVIIPPKGIVARRSTDMLAVADSRVARALRFMWDHLDWPMTVDDVAYEVGLNRRTLDRAFKNCLDRGVNAELRRKRLEQCCDLLRNTPMTIEQITTAIGFKSKPYLHRAFLKAYSLTPAEYRKKVMTDE